MLRALSYISGPFSGSVPRRRRALKVVSASLGQALAAPAEQHGEVLDSPRAGPIPGWRSEVGRWFECLWSHPRDTRSDND
jgi:hypothetical protein